MPFGIRIYNGKEMIYPLEFSIKVNTVDDSGEILSVVEQKEYKEKEWMRQTSGQAINGYIYEKDILEFSDGKIGIVVFDPLIGAFIVQKQDEMISVTSEMPLCQIVGNVFENPELLPDDLYSAEISSKKKEKRIMDTKQKKRHTVSEEDTMNNRDKTDTVSDDEALSSEECADNPSVSEDDPDAELSSEESSDNPSVSEDDLDAELSSEESSDNPSVSEDDLDAELSSEESSDNPSVSEDDPDEESFLEESSDNVSVSEYNSVPDITADEDLNKDECSTLIEQMQACKNAMHESIPQFSEAEEDHFEKLIFSEDNVSHEEYPEEIENMPESSEPDDEIMEEIAEHIAGLDDEHIEPASSPGKSFSQNTISVQKSQNSESSPAPILSRQDPQKPPVITPVEQSSVKNTNAQTVKPVQKQEKADSHVNLHLETYCPESDYLVSGTYSYSINGKKTAMPLFKTNIVPNITPHRLELIALMTAVEEIPVNTSVDVYTTIQYLVYPFTKGWIVNWASNGWRKSGCEERIQNYDLWRKLYFQVKNRKIKWHCIKEGEYKMNDKCANNAIDKFASLSIN